MNTKKMILIGNTTARFYKAMDTNNNIIVMEITILSSILSSNYQFNSSSNSNKWKVIRKKNLNAKDSIAMI